MDKAKFLAVAEIFEEKTDDYTNPFLTKARFVFTDDKGAPLSTAPAGLLQGIEFEDFDIVAQTALHMPVKMNFNGASVENHLGSYVVGHITNMEKAVAEDGRNQLIATAVLYKDEFPEEVKWMQEAHASGDAPGISYEVSYGNSIIKNGVQWIKDLVTCAATFVRSPAYGKRTALLALASAKTDSEFNDTLRTIIAQAAEETKEPIPSDKGGTNVDELEQAKAEAERMRAEAETRTAEIARLNEQLAEKDGEISTLTEEITGLKQAALIGERIRKYTEAGFTLEAEAEKSDKKKTFWLSLSDEDFDAYIEELVAVKATASTKTPEKALASFRTTPTIPKVEVPADVEGTLPSFRFRD